jgi:hypothetical protein
VKRPHSVLFTSLLLSGCASSQIAPTFAAAPSSATAEANREYDDMAVAAASLIRSVIPGKTIGIYISASSLTLREMAKTVIDAHDFREVRAGESRVVCASRASRGRAMPSCTLEVADVLLQLSSLQITRDSGFVGGLRTEVPDGGEKARTTGFCLMAFRQQGRWEAARYAVVETPRDCSSDRKH